MAETFIPTRIFREKPLGGGMEGGLPLTYKTAREDPACLVQQYLHQQAMTASISRTPAKDKKFLGDYAINCTMPTLYPSLRDIEQKSKGFLW